MLLQLACLANYSNLSQLWLLRHMACQQTQEAGRERVQVISTSRY